MEPIEFWIWFNRKKKGIENFLHSDLSDITPYEELTQQVKNYNELLIPEITIDELDRYVLIISCDGNREGIPAVEKLTGNIPTIENWVIKPYRQASGFVNFPIDGLSFSEKSILVKYEKVKGQEVYDIELYLKGYNASDRRYDIAAAVYLDHGIGEYNAMTKIRGASLKKLGLFTSREELLTLSEFKSVLDG